MKEWVLVPLTHAERWADLAERAFVRLVSARHLRTSRGVSGRRREAGSYSGGWSRILRVRLAIPSRSRIARLGSFRSSLRNSERSIRIVSSGVSATTVRVRASPSRSESSPKNSPRPSSASFLPPGVLPADLHLPFVIT